MRKQNSEQMAVSLRDLPIKRKLMLVILLTSSFALFLMGTALIVYERVTFRRALAVHPRLESGRTNLRTALHEVVKWN